jgi:predicted acyltransferase
MAEIVVQPHHSQIGRSIASDRLISLDALRGFDMLWIVGGSTIVGAAADATQWPWLLFLKKQFVHTDWNGFTPYDLIFPLFLFIAGVAMPFSFEKRLARGDSRMKLAQHVVIRGLLLVLFGIIYNNAMTTWDVTKMRYPSVLGRIGLASLFAGLIVLNTSVRGQVAWLVGVLVAYWAAMKFVPVPEFGAGDLAPGHNLADYIDGKFIPGVLLHPDPRHHVSAGFIDDVRRDPEGILSTIPAIGTALAGALTGHFLKTRRYQANFKTPMMLVAAAGCLSLGLVWDRDFPINKNLWSSSFVLYCAGWSLLLLSIFYLVIDVWRFRAWTLPLVVIGSNSILIYMANKFIFSGLLKFLGGYQPLVAASVVLAIEWLFFYVLYRRRFFLRI